MNVLRLMKTPLYPDVRMTISLRSFDKQSQENSPAREKDYLDFRKKLLCNRGGACIIAMCIMETRVFKFTLPLRQWARPLRRMQPRSFSRL